MQKQVGHSIGAADTAALHQEMADQKVENVFERKAPAPPYRQSTAPRSSIRPLGTISTISFRKDRPAPEVVANAVPMKTAEPAAPIAPSPIEPAAPHEPAALAGPALSFDDALKLGLLNFDGVPPIETPEQPATPEPINSALSPDTFAAALTSGLLNFEAEAPAEETPADQSAGTLSPDSFAEALKRGLFG
jgi:hypothetical protein